MSNDMYSAKTLISLAFAFGFTLFYHLDYSCEI